MRITGFYQNLLQKPNIDQWYFLYVPINCYSSSWHLMGFIHLILVVIILIHWDPLWIIRSPNNNTFLGTGIRLQAICFGRLEGYQC